MKYSTSKEKLLQIHQELDRQLQQVNYNPRSSTHSRKQKEDLRYHSNFDESKKNSAYRPMLIDHTVGDADIKIKKNEINELQRKLMELENKMNNIEIQSSDQQQVRRPPASEKQNLAYKHTQENEDTARFLLAEANKYKQKNKFQYSYPSMEDEEEEDSEDYVQIQRIIQKKKQQAKEYNRKNISKLSGLTNTNNDSKKDRETERKISTQAQPALKPKYSNQKSAKNQKNRVSNSKGSVRDSVTSKKSAQKNQSLHRANSKRSVKSNNSLNRSRSKNESKHKHDNSFDRFSEKNQQGLHGQQINLAKQVKKMGNLEKEVIHYKRLANKYKQQLEDYRIMEIQFKQLKKNFAKSQLIRTQQKKIIDSLRNKMGGR